MLRPLVTVATMESGATRGVHAGEELLLERELLGDGLEDEVGVGADLLEVLVAAGVHALRHGVGAHHGLRRSEPLVGLLLGAREEGHARDGLGEEDAAAEAHGAVRAEHDDVVELAGREQVLRGLRRGGHQLLAP
jgi:hypothetical protein